MPPSVKRVLLDLNNPTFQESWFNLQADQAERVRNAFKKVTQLTWNELYRDAGLKWERVQSIQAPDGVDALYTFRITQSVRGVGFRESDFLRVLLIQPDHDATYGKK
jgi:hypothetical protein